MSLLKKMGQAQYWKRRKAKSNFVFYLNKIKHKFINGLSDNRSNSKIELSTIGKVITRTVVASLAVAIFYIIEFYARQAVIQTPLGTLLKDIINYDYSGFISITIGILSVAGIFLGLYYTNTASVFSSRYASVPREVSKLFENEVVGKKYIKSLINYFIILLVIVFLNILGFKSSILISIIICFLGIRIIVIFGIIGFRVFQFSDFYSVCGKVYFDIAKSFRNASIRGRFWNDISFQTMYYMYCSELFDRLELINNVSLEEKSIKSRSVENFLTNNLSLLNSYCKVKGLIPFDSLWFEKRRIYPSWFITDDARISTALGSGTEVSYKEELNINWFEKRIFETNEKAVDKLIEDGNIDGLITYLNDIRYCIKQFTYNENFEFWYKELLLIEQKIKDSIIINTSKHYNSKQKASLVEMINILFIDCFLYFCQYAMKFDLSILEAHLKDGLKLEKNQIIGLKMPLLNSQWFSEICKQIIKEIQIEGKRITPDWFILQLVASKYSDFIIKNIDMLYKLYDHLLDNGNEYFMCKEYFITLLTLSGVNEFKYKFEHHMNDLETILKELHKYYIESSYPWKENNITVIQTLLSQSQKLYISKLARSAIEYYKKITSIDKEMPDYFGFAYNNLLNYLMETLLRNNYDEFQEGYQYNLHMAFIAEKQICSLINFENIFTNENIDWGALNLRIIPIIEFMEISGYAVYLGELLNDNRWRNIVFTTCDKYFELIQDKNTEYKRWIAYGSMEKDVLPPGIYNRSLLHTNWKIRYQNMVAERELIKFKDVTHFQRVVDNDSSLVENFYYDENIGYTSDFREIFLVLYLNEHVDNNDKYKSRSGWEKRLRKNKKEES